MNFESTRDVIRSRGYWYVNFHPSTTIEQPLVTTVQAKEIMQTTSVHLRGWDYPHVPPRDRDHARMYTRANAIESWIDWQDHKEVWRLSLNGQFVHVFGIREDWFKDSGWGPPVEPLTVVDVISVIYTLTEIHAFLAKLAMSDVGTAGSRVEIGIRNTANRKLDVLGSGRMPLWGDYVCYSSDVAVPTRTTSGEELHAHYLEWAVEAAVYVFGQFNWDTPNLELIRSEATKLAEGNLRAGVIQGP